MNKTEQFKWIIGDDALKALADQCRLAPVVALDTEFVRTETFYPQLGLIQLCIDEQVWLIDPLTITRWRPLADLFSDPSVVKVLHSLSEDVDVLQSAMGARLVNVFDTQIAASFLGYASQVSYAKLVEDLFGETLSKEVTRSDWLKRPLDQVQCVYAAADVHWLFKVYGQLNDQLEQQQRTAWVLEDSQRQANVQALAPKDYYTKMRGGWRSKGSNLVALQLLAEWRENLARNQDVNRGRILQDKDLILLAEKLPTRIAELQQSIKLPSRTIRLYGESILTLIEQARAARREAWPERIDGPLPADQAELYKQIKELITNIGERENIPVDVLSRRKLLEAWVRSGSITGNYQVPDVYTGWRSNYVVKPISELLTQQWADDEA